MKKKIYLLLIILGIALIPGIVNAKTVKVSIQKYGEIANLATYDVDENTTIGDIKSLLNADNIDISSYLIINNQGGETIDSDTVCGRGMYCSKMTINNEEYYSSYYSLALIDNTKYEIVLKSFQPSNEETFININEVYYRDIKKIVTQDDTNSYISYSSCNSDFTLCTFFKTTVVLNSSSTQTALTNINIKYDYDKEVQKIAQKVIDDGLFNNNKFEATELEALYYYNYGGSSLGNYTSSFKNQLNNTNFIVEMDTRAGGSNSPFENHEAGFTMFKYNGVLYGVKEYARIHTEHIIYIPTDSTNIKEAVEQRLKDLFGDEVYLTVQEGVGTVNECLQRDFGEDPAEYNYEDGDYVILTVNNPDNWINYGYGIYFRVIKDSSKIYNNASFKSRDLITDVSVSTEETIPLDTITIVNHITDGEKYNELMKKLNLPEGEVFDISLKSDAQDKMITKLDNGKFLVSIPIPEKYNGKSLVVYYVSEDGKITEHKVTPVDGYATFETDHFSTYTLAVTSNETTPSINPKTADNIVYYVLLFSFSVVCLVGTKLYLKRLNK